LRKLMDRDTFQAALERGLGRALLFLRANPNAPVSDIVLECCLRNTTYDPQCEGSRADYLYEILEATGQAEVLGKQIMTALAEDNVEDWDQQQVMDITQEFAERKKDPWAREILYKLYEQHDPVDDFPGEDRYIRLDGELGLKFIAQQNGRWLREERITWESFWFHVSIIDSAEKEMHLPLWSALQQFAQEDSDMERYLEALQRNRQKEESLIKRENFDAFTFDEIQAFINAGSRAKTGGRRGPYWYSKWGHDASDEEFQRAADFLSAEFNNLSAEEDTTKLQWYLGIFKRRAFPGQLSSLWELAHSSNETLAIAACRALHQPDNPDVRALAFELLRREAPLVRALELLVDNIQPGDEALLQEILSAQIDNDDYYHWAASDVLDILRDNRLPEEQKLLFGIYENGRCSICRKYCIKQLMRLDAAPDWLLNEGKYDSDPDIRELCNNPAKAARE
jgi:hypothetical protein